MLNLNKIHSTQIRFILGFSQKINYKYFNKKRTKLLNTMCGFNINILKSKL